MTAGVKSFELDWNNVRKQICDNELKYQSVSIQLDRYSSDGSPRGIEEYGMMIEFELDILSLTES